MYKVEYTGDVVKADLPKLTKDSKKRIRNSIEQKLRKDPFTFGKPLRYSLKGLRSLRVGDYRIIFSIELEKQTILIVKIGHRKEVYEG